MDDALNVEYESEAEEIEARQDFFEADLRILRGVEEELGSLSPPDRVRDAHREYTAALADLADVIAGLTERMTEVQLVVELEELLAEPQLQATTDRFDEACFELEALATRSDVDLELDCESGESGSIA